jgi:hypothetical protein
MLVLALALALALALVLMSAGGRTTRSHMIGLDAPPKATRLR